VVFSIFGRKKSTPKPDEKAGKAPAPAKPASAPTNVGRGDHTSLDFTTYSPPPRPDPSSAGAARAPISARASKPVENVTASPGAVAADGVAPVIEEAAILFANGQAQEALTTLSRAAREADLGPSALEVWLMLFDLYQHLRMRAEFDALALEFAVKFERSPPAWIESERDADPALSTGGIGYFAVSGALSGASAAGIEKLRGAAVKQRSVRIDFGKLQGLDSPGCRLLREALLSIRAAGTNVMLTGESQLLRLLEEACRPGCADTDGVLWALLLDVYRMLGDKDKFEETAVNYAVTFEMSPPSWETEVRAEKRAPEDEPSEISEQALVLSGEITGAEAGLAKRLQDWAAVYKMVVIDMSQVRRVDFVSAGLMLNVLSKLRQAGMTIQIRGANALIGALFRVMRIDGVARIIPRK